MVDVRRRLNIFLLIFVCITLLGTTGFMRLESLSFTDAFYYNIVTMSTVGYGDIHPTSAQARMFSILLIVLGGGSFLGVIANGTELLLLKREARSRMRKINVVLGIFFSETGYHLLGVLSDLDRSAHLIRDDLLIQSDWSKHRFSSARQNISRHSFDISASPETLENLEQFLNSRRRSIISLLENPAIVEDEGFSEALLSLSHLSDELSCRDRAFTTLPDSDIRHLEGDISRVYRYILDQWLYYLAHLKEHYPYLFSLALRRNP